MKVKALTDIAGMNYTMVTGRIYDLDDDNAERYIKVGVVEAVEPEKDTVVIETAVLDSVPELAIPKVKTSRKKVVA